MTKKYLLIPLFILVISSCGQTSSSSLFSSSNSSATSQSSSSSSSSSSMSSDQASSSVPSDQYPDARLLTASEHVVLSDVDENNVLADYKYLINGTTVLLNDFSFENAPADIVVTSNSFTALTKGIFMFDLVYQNQTFPFVMITKLASESEYVVYNETFSDLPIGTVPSNFTVRGNGDVGIFQRRMFIDSTGGKSNTLVLFPSYLQQFGNYIIETEMRVESFNERTRWQSLIYRYTPENEYFQMAIRQGATAFNGVEFAKWINNGWDVPRTISYKEDLVVNQWYSMKVDVLGTVAKEYINDELQVTYEQADDFMKGRIGVQTSGMTSGFRNVKVTIPETYLVMENTTQTTLPNIYQKNSGIINTPTAAQIITNLAMHQQVLGTVRPQVAIYGVNQGVDQSLQLTDATGNSLGLLADLLPLINEKVIMAFKPDTLQTNLALAAYLKEIALLDMFLVASDASYIQEARNLYPRIRGILEVSYDSNKPLLTEDDLTTLKNTINASEAVIGLLPLAYITRTNVEFLSKRLVTIWANGSNGSISQYEQAIHAGVYGIVTQDFIPLYSLFDTFAPFTHVRRPFIIGHRGIPSQAPENSMGGFKRAVELGADIIEYDIFITKDNRIVVMHDSTIDRTTNGTGSVEDMTLAQLRNNIKLNDNTGLYPNELIPTLDEVFDEFLDQDIVHFIEIKSGKEQLIPVLRNLIEEKAMFNNSVVISFNESQIGRVRDQIPEISTGFLNTSVASMGDVQRSVRNAINKLTPLRSTYNPEQTPLSNDLVQQLIYRGITTWPWTVRDINSHYRLTMMGVGGITTDYTQYSKDENTSLEASQVQITIQKDSFSAQGIQGLLRTQLGVTTPINLNLHLIDAGATGLTLSGTQITGVTQTGTAYVRGTYSSTYANGQAYVLTTSVITIVVV